MVSLCSEATEGSVGEFVGHLNEELILKYMSDMTKGEGKGIFVCGPGSFMSFAQELLLKIGYSNEMVRLVH